MDGHGHISGCRWRRNSCIDVFYLWLPDLPGKLSLKLRFVHKVLWNKYYVDELYDFIIVRPVMWTATNILVAVTDGQIIEGIVNGIPRRIAAFGEQIRKVQSGNFSITL